MSDPVNFSDLSALLGANVATTDKLLIQHLNGGEPAPDKFFTVSVEQLVAALTPLVVGPVRKWEVKTSGFTAVSFGKYIINVSGTTNINLPAAPAIGDEIVFTDYNQSFSTYIVAINRNGLKIEGLSDDLRVNVGHSTIKVVYTGTTIGWRVIITP